MKHIFRAYSLLGIDCISLMQRSISCLSKPKSWTNVRHDQAMWTTTTWKVLRCRLVGEQYLRWKKPSWNGRQPNRPYWISCSNQMWRGSKNEVAGAFCQKEAKCAFTKNDVTRMINMSLRAGIILNENIDDNLTAIQKNNTFNMINIMESLYGNELFHEWYII